MTTESVAARYRSLLNAAGLGPLVGLALVAVMAGLLPVAFVIATSGLLGQVPQAVAGGAGSTAQQGLLKLLLVAGALLALQQVLIPAQSALGEFIAARVDGAQQRRLMAAALNAPLEVLEAKGSRDELRVAAQELEFGVQSPGQAAAGLLALLARYLQLAGFVVLIGVGYAWWAGVVVAAVVAALRYGHVHGLRQYAQQRAALAGAERRIDYLRRLAVEPAAGKELRVFGLAEHTRRLLAQAYRAWLEPLWVVRRRIYLWPFVRLTLVGGLLLIVVLAAFGAHAVAQQPIGGFVLVVQAVLGAVRLAEYYPEADLQMAVGLRAAQAADHFVASAGSQQLVHTPAAPAPRSEVRFQDVSFRYPGGSLPVLDHLNLVLPAGRCTAVVGLNGAGKSTLVKLLARLYEPHSGTITADGRNIAEHPASAWQQRLAVIFQDFARFEVSAADNIGFGHPAALHDRAGIVRAAEQAGADEALRHLPGGLDIPLARHRNGGTDLSGGQWQRVALARALFAMQHGATIVVLDEPTAALDVRAEAHFFDEFRRITQGATTVLISHRFSTVRHADQIVVLQEGRVVEQGDHAQLLAARGRYAAMFRAQAHRFAGSPLQTSAEPA